MSDTIDEATPLYFADPVGWTLCTTCKGLVPDAGNPLTVEILGACFKDCQCEEPTLCTETFTATVRERR